MRSVPWVEEASKRCLVPSNSKEPQWSSAAKTSKSPATRERSKDRRMKAEGAEPYPSKRLGQHFLRDRRTIQRIIEALAPKRDETIVEIGPGTGALTSALVESAGRVVAVEFDRKLAPLLQERFGGLGNFKLVMADALTADFCAEILPAHKARLVANLPYNISTAILQRLIAQRACF